METWVLIWTLTFRYYGVATASQEFSTKANCEAAMQELLRTQIDETKLVVGCYQK